MPPRRTDLSPPRPRNENGRSGPNGNSQNCLNRRGVLESPEQAGGNLTTDLVNGELSQRECPFRLHNFENPRDITQKHKIARQIADSFDLLKMCPANPRQFASIVVTRLCSVNPLDEPICRPARTHLCGFARTPCRPRIRQCLMGRAIVSVATAPL
jgi:hypothetical protein